MQVFFFTKALIFNTIDLFQSNNLNLSSKKTEAPRLVIAENSDRTLNQCFVVGEGIEVDVGHNLKEAVLRLLFCYYVWDLSYPKQYQLLGLVQHYILKDRKNKFHMSANYLKFCKKLEDTLNSN